MIELSNDREYKELLRRIIADIEATRARVVSDANTEIVSMYWRIGSYIDEHAEWGSKYIPSLSTDIRATFPGVKGYFERTLPAPESELAQQQLKDPYIFDFITTRQDIAEREIEQAMVRNVTSTLLELGNGFAFLGNQYHLAVNDTDFFIDLLFYNTKLRSYVVVELKNEAFKPEFTGKLNFYLTAVDELMRGEYDNPTIGLLLCREKDDVIAEWSLRDIEKPMGVSEYRLADVLPDAEALQWRIAESLEGERDE